MSENKSIGVLGQGIIGSRVADHLRAAGHTVTVWSQTGRAMPGSVATVAELAQQAEVIQIFLRDDAALLAAVEAMQPQLTPQHVVMNHATVSRAATLKSAELCAAAGAAFMDAPFTGSKMAAQNAKLAYYVGGDAAVLERVRPILELSSAQILPLLAAKSPRWWIQRRFRRSSNAP
jgi:3-hydroxyisobutyrate dehydrogenase